MLSHKRFIFRQKTDWKREMQYMAFCSHNPYQNYQQLLFQADLIIVSFVILINFTDSLLCVIAPKVLKIFIFSYSSNIQRERLD